MIFYKEVTYNIQGTEIIGVALKVTHIFIIPHPGQGKINFTLSNIHQGQDHVCHFDKATQEQNKIYQCKNLPGVGPRQEKQSTNLARVRLNSKLK